MAAALTNLNKGWMTENLHTRAAATNSVEAFNSEVWMTEFPVVDGDEICVFIAAVSHRSKGQR